MFNIFKKLFLLALFIFLFLPFKNAFAQETPALNDKEVNVYFFWSNSCPHCAKEKPFLEKLEQKYPQLKISYYEVSDSKSLNLLIEFGKKLNADVNGVPFTVVGEKYFTGWLDEAYTGAQIEDAVKCALNQGCRDIGAEIIAQKSNKENGETKKKTSAIPQQLTLPLLGTIETESFSLPVLTIVLGALDGFNPCAMWTLLFLISLLLGMQDRKRMWILGSIFIVASASVYFLFMAAWLNLILFIGMVIWVRIVVGLIALIGGGHNLKEYFTNKYAACKVTNSEKRQKVFEKLKNIAHQKSFFLAIGGIIVLAFAVNLVELICSAGLPAIYTQILALSNLNTWQYYSYILLYIFFFMLDDLFIFIVAMVTLRMTGITTKYTRLSYLIGGVLMLTIGLLLIFKPELLMFG
jgi:thiol-disulfide isomerase/thioredoxin